MRLRKNKITATAAGFCALCLLLSGCSAVFDKEYRYEEPYEEEYSDLKEDTSIQEVKNYVGMKNAILNLINNAADKGIIRTGKYSGSAEEDISKACFEVTRETPMGLYAVDYMTHSITRIVSYYEIEIYITYKRSAEEISGVATLRSEREIREKLSEEMRNFADKLAIMQISTDIGEEAMRALIDSCYREDPMLIPQKPESLITVYSPSDDNIQQISEIELTWELGREELSRRAAELEEYCGEFLKAGEDIDAEYICRSVLNRTEPGDWGNTAYDALKADCKADSEGYAMAVKLLCGAADIDCRVVEGRFRGEPHFWNILAVGGGYCHVDVYNDDLYERDIRFMIDGDMLGDYWWDITLYPACEEQGAVISGLEVPLAELPGESE